MTIKLQDIYGLAKTDILPAGGTQGQILGVDASGDAVWDDLPNLIVPTPAAGISQSITAADPADVPLELTPSCGADSCAVEGEWSGYY